MYKPRLLPPYIVNGVFVIGLISATAFRSLIVLEEIDRALVRPVWYGAVFGYILFFGYRWYIASRRRRTISENGLIEKVRDASGLDEAEKEEVLYILGSIMKSREIFNYLFIFIMSFIAVAADLFLLFFRE